MGEKKKMKMEMLSSRISERWKLCTFGSLVSLVLLVLLINQNHQPVNVSAVRNTVVFSTQISCADQKSNLSSSSSGAGSEIATTTAASGQEAVLENTEKLPAAAENNKTTTRASNSTWTKDSSETPAAAAVQVIDEQVNNKTRSASGSSSTMTVAADEKQMMNETGADCDIFDGRWVYKAENVPLYSTESCPFIEEKMSCRKNGRPDSDYEKWSWEPYNCHIPEFNGRDMMERLRGKRIIVVGDSLNRNQWESIACLLYTSIPSSRSFVDANDAAYKVFRALDYDFVVEFYWSPFLVELEEKHKMSGSKVLVLDKLPSSSEQWKGADIMIFNSAHWWIHLGKYRAWDLFEYKNKLTKEMKMETAYSLGLTTWSNWIKHNVNPNKTTVFFRSISSEHNGNHWCYNSTAPIADHSSYEQRYPRSMIDVVESKIKEMGNTHPIKYLNITKMSEYRIDGHPSVYRSNYKWKYMTTKYKRLLRGFADCSHWCLPGVPDTWNRLLYVSLFLDTLGTKGLSGSGSSSSSL